MTDTFAVEPRSVLGKRVKRLRREGILPANIYGRNQASVAVQLGARDVRTLLIEHGTNTLVELKVEGEAKPRPVVVRDVQRHPVSREIQHLDFYEVDINRAIQAMVPVHLVGEAPAVHTHRGVVLTSVDAIEIEALPGDMPTAIELSIESLTELEMQLLVSDLELPPGVTLLTDPEAMVVRVAPPRVEEEAETDELLEGEEALAEGEEPAEGEAADSDEEQDSED